MPRGKGSDVQVGEERMVSPATTSPVVERRHVQYARERPDTSTSPVSCLNTQCLQASNAV